VNDGTNGFFYFVLVLLYESSTFSRLKFVRKSPARIHAACKRTAAGFRFRKFRDETYGADRRFTSVKKRKQRRTRKLRRPTALITIRGRVCISDAGTSDETFSLRFWASVTNQIWHAIGIYHWRSSYARVFSRVHRISISWHVSALFAKLFASVTNRL